MNRYPTLTEKYRSQYPKIDASELKAMWHCRYYDGPLDGVVQFENKPHYYDAVRKRLPSNYSNNKIVGWFEWLWGSIEIDEI